VYDVLGKKLETVSIKKVIWLQTTPLDLMKFSFGDYLMILKSNAHAIEKKY
jgi:hypothetical protein